MALGPQGTCIIEGLGTNHGLTTPLAVQMLERESNKEKNLEKALKEAKAKARREAAAKSSAAATEDAADIEQVLTALQPSCICSRYADNA